MNFREACVKAKEIADKYKKEIERELNEQCVSGEVASVVSYEIFQAIERVSFYMRGNDLCSQGQFLRSLDIILRNRAKSAAEQLEVFSQVPEDDQTPEDDDDKDD